MTTIRERVLSFAILLLSSQIHSQNPYKIDEGIIHRRVDTTINLSPNSRVPDSLKVHRVIICFDKLDKVVRIDKVFKDKTKYAYAYFKDKKFDRLQWNVPEAEEIREAFSRSYLMSVGNAEIRAFYLSLCQLSFIVIDKHDRISTP